MDRGFRFQEPWLWHPPGAVSKARPHWDVLVPCGREVGVRRRECPRARGVPEAPPGGGKAHTAALLCAAEGGGACAAEAARVRAERGGEAGGEPAGGTSERRRVAMVQP